jgi:hypothetical protein
VIFVVVAVVAVVAVVDVAVGSANAVGPSVLSNPLRIRANAAVTNSAGAVGTSPRGWEVPIPSKVRNPARIPTGRALAAGILAAGILAAGSAAGTVAAGDATGIAATAAAAE